MACCGVNISVACYGGGSGAGFIGKVYLRKGTYTVTIGHGQYTITSDQSISFSPRGDTSISDIVVAYGGDTQTAGSAPALSITPVSTTLNTAGNNGSSTGAINDTSGAIRGESVYGSYGVGAVWQGEGVLYTGSSENDHTSGNGYVKVIYKNQ